MAGGVGRIADAVSLDVCAGDRRCVRPPRSVFLRPPSARRRPRRIPSQRPKISQEIQCGLSAPGPNLRHLI